MKVLIVRNDYNVQATDASLLLATYLATQQVDYALVDSSELGHWAEGDDAPSAHLIEGVDLAVALGGDGTILRVAHLAGTSGIPILGLNFGRLGFLANTSEDGVVAAVAAALSGDVVEERRTNLRVDVVCDGEVDPYEDAADLGEGGGRFPRKPIFALNEVAVTRGAFGRMIDFELGISGAHIADMRGDGLVVATATGSTAYALSAGGPLVSPGFGGLVVVPLAPHSLRSRAIVTAESDVVEMTLSQSVADRESVVFVDGEPVAFEAPVRRAYVRRGETPTTLLRYQREGFYEHAAKTFF